MALAKTVKFSEFLVKLGNGGDPEVFAAPCGLTSRGLNRTAESSSVNVIDCLDEAAPAWTENEVVALGWSLPGSGVLDRDAVDEWDDWFQSGLAKNITVTIAGTGANGGRVYAGAAIITTLNFSAAKADNAGRVAVEVEILGTGKLTPTASA